MKKGNYKLPKTKIKSKQSLEKNEISLKAKEFIYETVFLPIETFRSETSSRIKKAMKLSPGNGKDLSEKRFWKD